MNNSNTLKNTNLDKIIKRVVEVANPEKVILFGSAARNEAGPDSDIDLLVVKSNVHRRKLAQNIYMNLLDIDQAVDVVVVSPEDVDKYRHSHGLILEPALRDGIEVYAA